MLSAQQRADTLARFERHRRAWDGNESLRALYAEWYGRIAAALPPADLGPRIELGSGPGFSAGFIPDLVLTDLVAAPWHRLRMSADFLPFASGSLGALVVFDVLHHLASPAALFNEALRTLRRGGRLVACEPYLSLLSYPIYRFVHDERDGLDVRVDWTGTPGVTEKDPFASNQAIPTILFKRRRTELAALFPGLRLLSSETMAGPSYPATGGFSRRPLLPASLWRALHRLEGRLPPSVFKWIGFRLLAVMERV